MPKKEERNNLIVDLWYSRWSIAAIARYFRISRQRVWEIIHRETKGHMEPYFNHFTNKALFAGYSPKEIADMVTVGRIFKVNSDKEYLDICKNATMSEAPWETDETRMIFYNGEKATYKRFKILEDYMIARYNGMEDIA